MRLQVERSVHHRMLGPGSVSWRTVSKLDPCARQEMVSDAIALVVDFTDRLIRCADPEAARDVGHKAGGTGAEHAKQNANPHN
eukprot:7291824-Prymnesium_polylepis.1